MRKYNIVEGQIFGKLQVLYENTVQGKHRMCTCRCECGNIKSIRVARLMSGHAKSCGCSHTDIRTDLLGKKFGRLTVIKYAGKNSKGRSTWMCQCDCGNYCTVEVSMLSTGNTKSCGCLHYDCKLDSLKRLHKRLYGVWAGMKNRCYNPNEPKYKDYGARGIKVCDEWKDNFEAFCQWAYANGYDSSAAYNQCTIDRIDVNGDYEPFNCRWADGYVQGNNKRNNILITIHGVTHTVSEWSNISGLKRKTIIYRYQHGWAEKDILLPILIRGRCENGAVC